ncbi:MAG: LysM peptidoglycan-binding domain-containing protein [Clostridiales bacterium]|jgi:LysM repeat protein|nr:LysM peptidoglycan-binding domain-containing protein [Clostridiales bacterium]
MIESVYSNDNADANRTDIVHTDFRMPKNIRQIGKSNNSKKIYVEDYVMTFTKQLPGEDYSTCRVAVLVGQYVKTPQGRCIFISGALEVEGMDLSDGIVFTNDHWTAIYENIKKYFVEAEIVGWFIGGPGYLLEDKEKILKAHIDNFAGQDKTLLTFDNMEKEESFYLYENGSLSKQEGFYIYYEKNEEMQIYMIVNKGKPSEEEQYDDRVSREIRTILQNKKPANEHKNISYLMYAAGTLLAVIILVVGAAMLSNYDHMKSMQDTLDSLSNNLKEIESVFIRNENNKAIVDNTAEPKTDIPVSTDGSLNVEVVPGGVSPLPEKDEEDKLSDEEPISNPPSDISDDVSDDKEASAGQISASDTQAEVKYYTVKAGDSLAGISHRLYNSANYISVIKKLNNIEDEDMIYIGQKLILP